jgi:hypothetical protein
MSFATTAIELLAVGEGQVQHNVQVPHGNQKCHIYHSYDKTISNASIGGRNASIGGNQPTSDEQSRAQSRSILFQVTNLRKTEHRVKTVAPKVSHHSFSVSMKQQTQCMPSERRIPINQCATEQTWGQKYGRSRHSLDCVVAATQPPWCALHVSSVLRCPHVALAGPSYFPLQKAKTTNNND